jgi:transposase
MKNKTKKNPVVYKTDKIANLHRHEVLRTPVRNCELNPIELIWAQVKGT